MKTQQNDMNEIIDYYNNITLEKSDNKFVVDFFRFLKSHILNDTSYEKNDENTKKLLDLNYLLTKQLRTISINLVEGDVSCERANVQVILSTAQNIISLLTLGTTSKEFYEKVITNIYSVCWSSEVVKKENFYIT